MNINYSQYEEPDTNDVEVCAVVTLEKHATLMGSEKHKCVEREIEDDGSYSYSSHEESDDDPRDLWEKQELHMKDILSQCEDILAQLQLDLKVRKYADHDITTLREAIAGWEETEWDVYHVSVEEN